MDLDIVLNMISNPTRRRILESLTREPSYPLRLSREIGVSQQAIMKNLDLLERNGMVMSRQVCSTIGPMRAVYEPTTEFTVVVDMRRCMFSADVKEEKDNDNEKIVDAGTFDDIRSEMARLDKEIEELERRRSALIGRRQNLFSWAMSLLDGEDFTSLHRDLMYQMLKNPDLPEKEIVRMMTQKEDIEKKMEEIAKAMLR